MKVKKSILAIITVLFGLIIFGMQNTSEASTPVNPPIYMGVQEYRTDTDPANMAYGIGNPDRNGSDDSSMVGKKIWDLVEYASAGSSTFDNSKNYYCVKADVGFRNINDRATYNLSYDLVNEKSEIQSSSNTYIKDMVNDDDIYYGLLALVDMLYLPGVSETSEKTELINAALTAAGIPTDRYTVEITDTDIEAIQQAAVWYFTEQNDELFATIYNQLGYQNTSWFTYKLQSMSEYKSFSDYNLTESTRDGEQRQLQAVYIYNYLINTAKTNATEYKNGTMKPQSDITLYINSEDMEQQPVIIIDRIPKEFDLSLRKYITEIDGEPVANTRVPIIDTTPLANETDTTAEYNHRKDPVRVTTGTIVTYNITVYNEGRIDGYVNEIKDQLPEGLRYVSMTPDANYTASYDETQNVVTIRRNDDAVASAEDGLLSAYDGGDTLDSITFGIQCEVTSVTSNDILTNVAYITEEQTADGTIIEQGIEDRDSEPSVTPDVNQNNMDDYRGNNENPTDLANPDYFYKGEQDDDDFEKLIVEVSEFDLKLIKKIDEINGEEVEERLENVDVTNLANGTATTADYQMNKEPLLVQNGDIVKYTLRVYNEGEIDGYASEITEDVPAGLEFLWSEQTDTELEADTTLTELEKEAIKYNQGIWNIETMNTETGRIEMISTDYLAKGQGAELINEGANLIKAFDSSKGYVDTATDKNPDYKEISVYMKVISENGNGEIIRNEAAITGDTDANGEEVDDRDSSTDNWVKYEDDEDYDNVKLKIFDLALRKFITGVNDEDVTTRVPEVSYDAESNEISYEHDKTPIQVATNDVVTYTIRIFNEGETAGYAEEVADDIPDGLEFLPDNEINKQYRWTMYDAEGNVTENVSEAVRVVTDYLSKANGETMMEEDSSTENPNLLQAFDKEQAISETNPDYRDVQIAFRVIEPTTSDRIITNSAQIEEDANENGEPVDDIDSTPGEWNDGEDDQDQEHLELTYFDLALRKFITGVNDEAVTTRVPEVSYDAESDKINYEHDKTPVEVTTNDIVTYTIRIFNEGETAGYAEEVADDIPDGLEFLPDNETNQKYRWVMYDAEGNVTEDVSQAERVVTDYLSMANGESMMEEDDTLTENPNLLQPFDKESEISETNPDYRDVQIAFRVIEPATSDKILTNSAQIEEDADENGNPVDDIDSTPGEWNDGEDDQDQEHLELTYFDLALRKWVTQAIVIENGKETITQTGHTAEMDPEPVVKVELNRHNLDNIEVKFRYSIRVTNEGEIAGYAKEITDYVPEGLRFVAEDNPGWTDEGNNVISTRLLENTLLQPGESAEVEVLLTWIKGENNLGLKTNVAEISEDYNDKGYDDIDSTPDNKKEGEDDIDDAEVLLSISTGQAKIYIGLGLTVLITLGGGIALIKKFVL